MDDGLILGQAFSAIACFLSKLQNVHKIKIKEKPMHHMGYAIEWNANSIAVHHQNYFKKVLQMNSV